ncbi:MAG: cysteine desulfurase-like protein [Planctomycetaceae bacterium]|nr:cysteine desulfurase-like protein [Planctomycetaceae bacterium]
MTAFPVDWIRTQFPALSRQEHGRPVAYFDGPAGSQVPQSVANAVSRYLLTTNSNRGGVFTVAQESDAIVDTAHQAAANLFGTNDPACTVFGANMTTLTLAVSRALARTWNTGDEVLVTRLDHDANVTPWILAARDAGAIVKHVDVHLEDGTLDQTSFRNALSSRTKLVAIGYASNVTGTINPIAPMIAAAKAAGALTFIDAVHYAPHGLIDVTALGCDFLACSAYKFFGPHVGLLYGRRDLLEEITPYKLRVSSNQLPGKWMTGTQAHESLAGVSAAIRYLADMGRRCASTDCERTALQSAFAAIRAYEQTLSERMLAGLRSLGGYRVWGLTDAARIAERVPTFSLTHARCTPKELAERLAAEGLYAWCGNHYGLPFTEAAGLEPHGTLRIGLLHYNTVEEVDRVLEALERISV